MGAFLILRCGGRERESGMRQSTSVFFSWGGGPFQLDGRILDSPVRRSRARIGNAPIHFCFFFLRGGGDPFSWMGAFLILRCGVRERESEMRQSTSLFFLGGGETPSVGWRQSTFCFCGGGGGRPLQLDGRILDSPVRRSRARIGNAPIHFCFFFLGGGGETLSAGWAHS